MGLKIVHIERFCRYVMRRMSAGARYSVLSGLGNARVAFAVDAESRCVGKRARHGMYLDTYSPGEETRKGECRLREIEVDAVRAETGNFDCQM